MSKSIARLRSVSILPYTVFFTQNRILSPAEMHRLILMYQDGKVDEVIQKLDSVRVNDDLFPVKTAIVNEIKKVTYK